MQEIFDKYLIELTEAVKAGASLVGEQASALFVEIGNYGFWASFADASFWGLLAIFTFLSTVIISVFTIKKYLQSEKNSYSRDDWSTVIACVLVFGLGLTLGFSNNCMGHVKKCLQAKYAPRLFVITYINDNLINKNTRQD